MKVHEVLMFSNTLILRKFQELCVTEGFKIFFSQLCWSWQISIYRFAKSVLLLVGDFSYAASRIKMLTVGKTLQKLHWRKSFSFPFDFFVLFWGGCGGCWGFASKLGAMYRFDSNILGLHYHVFLFLHFEFHCLVSFCVHVWIWKHLSYFVNIAIVYNQCTVVPWWFWMWIDLAIVLQMLLSLWFLYILCYHS